ncbi:hypothetical protein B0T10DRAFT_542219 [Thelonectria olida]|uniref:Uncharacterized protein n=1 Tax=Thelonectria olida TaxID=1576542 RepID=A0A9P9AWL7_9HYPO|nr:hypothetical protein B0T10DRAFT_542219 [Thelonectria olida]
MRSQRTTLASLRRAILVVVLSASAVRGLPTFKAANTTTLGLASTPTPASSPTSLQNTSTGPVPVTGTRVENFPFLGPDIPNVEDPSTFMGGVKLPGVSVDDSAVSHKKKKKQLEPNYKLGHFVTDKNRGKYNTIPNSNPQIARPYFNAPKPENEHEHDTITLRCYDTDGTGVLGDAPYADLVFHQSHLHERGEPEPGRRLLCFDSANNREFLSFPAATVEIGPPHSIISRRRKVSGGHGGKERPGHSALLFGSALVDQPPVTVPVESHGSDGSEETDKATNSAFLIPGTRVGRPPATMPEESQIPPDGSDGHSAFHIGGTRVGRPPATMPEESQVPSEGSDDHSVFHIGGTRVGRPPVAVPAESQAPDGSEETAKSTNSAFHIGGTRVGRPPVTVPEEINKVAHKALRMAGVGIERSVVDGPEESWDSMDFDNQASVPKAPYGIRDRSNTKNIPRTNSMTRIMETDELQDSTGSEHLGARAALNHSGHLYEPANKTYGYTVPFPMIRDRNESSTVRRPVVQNTSSSDAAHLHRRSLTPASLNEEPVTGLKGATPKSVEDVYKQALELVDPAEMIYLEENDNGLASVQRTADVWTSLKDKSGKYLYIDYWATVIDVINATPYRWKRGHISSYQLPNWKDDWPEYIEPGQTFRIISYCRHGTVSTDTAGEVVYHLQGTRRPASFSLERRPGKQHHVWVKFLEELQTDTNGKHDELDLGYHQYPGGSQFILAGKEGDFSSNSIHPQWMQKLLPDIGHLSLREIVMPRSHHVGMSKAAESFGLGRKANTLCQTKTAAEQIEKFGIRVLDIRPYKYKHAYHAAHGSKVLGAWNGMFGEKIEDIAKAIGDFHKHYPGELIIVDLAEESGRIEYGWQAFNEIDRIGLYKLFKDHARLTKLPEKEDITRWPLRKFIGDGKSATIVRVPDSWAKHPDYPGAKEGFVTGEGFPTTHRWSDTNKVDRLAEDQLVHLITERPHRDWKMHHADWIITQDAMQTAFPSHSITQMALPAYSALWRDMWRKMTDSTYPNWIAMDNIHSTALTSFVKTINKCHVARKCGKLGGKIKGVDHDGNLLDGLDRPDDDVMKKQEKEEEKKKEEEDETKKKEEEDETKKKEEEMKKKEREIKKKEEELKKKEEELKKKEEDNKKEEEKKKKDEDKKKEKKKE